MTAIELGATLYVPATHASAMDVAYGSIPELRSMVICLEDSILDAHIAIALDRVQELLRMFATTKPSIAVYVRPRNFGVLTMLMQMDGIGGIDGFVLPKVTTHSLPHWLSALMSHNHRIMPTIECTEAFDRGALASLCNQLVPFRDRVTAVRIGGNDILNMLGIRRSRYRTAYDGPLGNVIRDFAATFIPNGFAVAAPVFEHYAAPDVLLSEIEQDIEHGLLTKTAIHPDQVRLIHAAYRPSVQELAEARAILSHDAPAVFGQNGSMCEPATHVRWAKTVLERAKVHGTAGTEQTNEAWVA